MKRSVFGYILTLVLVLSSAAFGESDKVGRGGGQDDRRSGPGRGGDRGGGQSLSSMREGSYNYRGYTYYWNAQGAYCEQPSYNRQAQEFTDRQYEDLRRMRFDGMCSGYLKGPTSYQGVSYYISTTVYCKYRNFVRDAREMRSREAQEMFRLRYAGICQ